MTARRAIVVIAMPSAGRSGDRAAIEHDSHGCPCCPHGTSGSAVAGSGDVFVNGSKALRLGDQGTHGGCCGSSSWRAAMGWGSVLVNGKPIHCQGDATEHCGGIGALSVGSPDVIVGEWVSRGGGGRGGTVFQLQIDTPMFLQVPVGGIYVSPQQTLATIMAFRHGLQAGLGALVGQAEAVLPNIKGETSLSLEHLGQRLELTRRGEGGSRGMRS